ADVAATLFDPQQKVFNLNKMNSRPESVLSHDSGPRLAGIHTSYLFLGMWRSTFSWHVEDMVILSLLSPCLTSPRTCTASATCTAGPRRPGTWCRPARPTCRSVSPAASSPALACHNLLRNKSVILQPELLEANGITVHRLLQEERQAVAVFPSAYHAGFNHGFNIAEAVNFGTARWVEYGKRAHGCQCDDKDNFVTIDMGPLVARFQTERSAEWTAGRDFGLHPEDPAFLHRAYTRAQDRLQAGEITEEQMEAVKESVRTLGCFPSWYEERFGVEPAGKATPGEDRDALEENFPAGSFRTALPRSG
ncbi:MAG: hypothetical protein GY823_04425, partial [Flavobacteriaceae bacterium]|nr:hypothetical protein [Flavobacteriaceae bacterium]